MQMKNILKTSLLGLFLVVQAQAVIAKTVQATSLADAATRAGVITPTIAWSGNFFRSVAPTFSMWPILDHGTILVCGKKPWKDVKVGDIIAVGHGKEQGLIHEVVIVWIDWHGVKTVVTSGYNNRWKDPGVWTENDYRYAVHTIIRYKNVARHRSMTPAEGKAWQQDQLNRGLWTP